ncbi:hypothetical protein MAR_015963 [Mya arenaria]|uniref:Uncharacterized protein n=1 Tax=Mya arenaria TaxID=6604 RepID=A0ABY7FKX7_MYAAR|nr:hypothetical protein MAR_015963 [Mya arenaria]
MFEIENGKINTTNPSVWVHDVGFLNTVRVTTVEIYGIYQTVGIEIKCLQDEAYIRLYVGKVTPPERGVFAPTLRFMCVEI